MTSLTQDGGRTSWHLNVLVPIVYNAGALLTMKNGTINGFFSCYLPYCGKKCNIWDIFTFNRLGFGLKLMKK